MTEINKIWIPCVISLTWSSCALSFSWTSVRHIPLGRNLWSVYLILFFDLSFFHLSTFSMNLWKSNYKREWLTFISFHVQISAFDNNYSLMVPLGFSGRGSLSILPFAPKIKLDFGINEIKNKNRFGYSRDQDFRCGCTFVGGRMALVGCLPASTWILGDTQPIDRWRWGSLRLKVDGEW